MAVTVDVRDDGGKLSKALNRFTKEDPTFRVTWDEEAREVIFTVQRVHHHIILMTLEWLS